MSDTIVMTADEAKQNLFKLLESVKKGNEAIIVDKNRDLKFRVSLKSEKKKKILKKHRGLDKLQELAMKARREYEEGKTVSLNTPEELEKHFKEIDEAV